MSSCSVVYLAFKKPSAGTYVICFHGGWSTRWQKTWRRGSDDADVREQIWWRWSRRQKRVVLWSVGRSSSVCRNSRVHAVSSTISVQCGHRSVSTFNNSQRSGSTFNKTKRSMSTFNNSQRSMSTLDNSQKSAGTDSVQQTKPDDNAFVA